MAFSKIILNGVTQIDLTADTVASENLISPHTAHDASGQVIVGMASGGGLDIPIYTQFWNPEGTQIMYITCNKTFAECYAYASDSSAVAITDADATGTYDNYLSGTLTIVWDEAIGEDVIYITFGGYLGKPQNELIHSPDGTISLSVPPKLYNTLNVTTNGTYTAPPTALYDPIVVNVPSGGMNKQIYFGTATRTANSYGATAVSLTVAVTGTYKVSWTAWRSSSTGTMGTNLHVNNTSGTNQQTFTSTYGQRIELTGQRYNQGDVLTLYATSGSTSRSIIVANLIIEQTA